MSSTNTGLLVAAFLLFSSCGEVGRYQMEVTPPYSSGGTEYDPILYVCDTKTGKVWVNPTTDLTLVTIDLEEKERFEEKLSNTKVNK